jgi:hypothetical protein
MANTLPDAITNDDQVCARVEKARGQMLEEKYMEVTGSGQNAIGESRFGSLKKE